MLWKVEIRPAAQEPNRAGERLAHEAEDLGLARSLQVDAAHGYLIQGSLDLNQARQLARELLVDGVVEQFRVAAPGDAIWNEAPNASQRHLVHVMPKPGVMDPVAQSTLAAITSSGFAAEAVRTFRSYWLSEVSSETLPKLCGKLLANDAIEQVVVGPLPFDHLDVERRIHVQAAARRDSRTRRRGLDAAQQAGPALSAAGRDADDSATLSRAGPRPDRRRTGNDRADLERTLQPQDARRPRFAIATTSGERSFENMLKETIFAATQEIRKQLGRRRLVRQRVQRQRRRRPVRRRVPRLLQGRNAQPSVGARAVRRREHRPRRRHSRSARHRPGREADLQHRCLLLRPARHAGRRAAAGRAASAARDAAASSAACATTATGWAFPRSTARSTSTSATSAIRWSTAATSA